MKAMLEAMQYMGLQLEDQALQVPGPFFVKTILSYFLLFFFFLFLFSYFLIFFSFLLRQEPAMKFLDDVRDLLERAPIELFKRLWRDQGIKAAYKRRREYQLSDSTA